jgi:hypothetical protein
MLLPVFTRPTFQLCKERLLELVRRIESSGIRRRGSKNGFSTGCLGLHLKVFAKVVVFDCCVKHVDSLVIH